MKAALLTDRGVLKLAGDDAASFLNGLVTSEVGAIAPGTGRFAALLTPQGKITVDFLVTAAPAGHGGGLLIDCPRSLAASLAAKLSFYKLRAKVTVENLGDDLSVLALWDGAPQPTPDLTFADPRDAALGWRMLVPAELAPKAAAMLGADLTTEDDYEAHRIGRGVPRGGYDFAYGDAFPHEANMDRLAGVDFRKGCYVGQEVVSRMQHRGTARSRVVRVRLDSTAMQGNEVRAGDKPVGTMGSSEGGLGLALLRLDRVADALQAGAPLTCGDATLSVADPADLELAAKHAAS